MAEFTLLTDEQLVSQYVEGNNEAFNVLLARYESKVFTYISYYVRNQEMSEDLFQDVFMRVCTNVKAGRYSEQQHFKAWLFRLVHNLLADHFRREANRSGISCDEETIDERTENNAISTERNAEQTMINEQNLSGLRDIIRLLPENQQQIIQMRYFDDMNFKDIAEILGISINTALGRVRYALINLRRLANQRGIGLAS